LPIYIRSRKEKTTPSFSSDGRKTAKNNHYPQLTTPYYKGQKTKKKPTQLHILTPPAKGLTERKKQPNRKRGIARPLCQTTIAFNLQSLLFSVGAYGFFDQESDLLGSGTHPLENSPISFEPDIPPKKYDDHQYLSSSAH